MCNLCNVDDFLNLKVLQSQRYRGCYLLRKISGQNLSQEEEEEEEKKSLSSI